MGSPSPAGTRRLLPVLALCALLMGAVVTLATAAGPGGWDHLGDRGTPGSDSLDLVASALAVTPGALYVGGEFTDAGGIPEADRIATWNGEQLERGQLVDVADLERSRIRHRRIRRKGLRRWHLPERGRRRQRRLPRDLGRRELEAVLRCDRAGVRRQRDQLGDHRPDALRRRLVPGRRGHRVRRLPARLRPGDRRRELHGPRPCPPLLRSGVRADGRQQRHAVRGRRVHQPREPHRRRQRRLPALGGRLAAHGRGRRVVRLRGHHLRPRSHRRGERRVHRHGRKRCRGHPTGRPRCQMEWLGVERPGRRQRRRERVAPDDDLDQRPDQRRLVTSSSQARF